MDRPISDRPGTAGCCVSAELATLVSAAQERPSANGQPAVVLPRDPFYGGVVLLLAVPRSGTLSHRFAGCRSGVQPGQLRRPHRLAADAQRRRLDAAGISVSLARRARLSSLDQRRSVRLKSRHGVAQRPSSGPDSVNAGGYRKLGLFRVWQPVSDPLRSIFDDRDGVGGRAADSARARIWPAFLALGRRAESGGLA